MVQLWTKILWNWDQNWVFQHQNCHPHGQESLWKAKQENRWWCDRPSIHKVKLKVARNEKKVLGFSFYKNIANIEACLLQLKKLSTNLFFWRVCCLHLVYLHTSISTCILWPAAIITDEWLSGTWLGCYTTEY